MGRITDDSFGELELEEDYDRWLRNYEIVIFSRKHKVVLIVEGNDDESQIYIEQRNAFDLLEGDKDSIIHELEKSLFAYYQSEAARAPELFEGLPIVYSTEELSQLLKLRWIRFPIVYDKGEILFGFLFDCSWDPEHGVAARYDNKALSIGQQDILP